MKQTIVTCLIAVCALAGFSQTRTAAIGFLYTFKPEVTFYGNMNAQAYANTRAYFQHGQTFNDEILFTDISGATKRLAGKLGFHVIPEDSVITTPEYKALVVKNNADKGSIDVLAKGYAYHSNFALLFSKTNKNPDVMIEAYGSFELNFIDAENTTLQFKMTIVGFNEKKKKVFVFKSKDRKAKDRLKVKVKASGASNWGYEIAEDISQKESDCVTFAIGSLEEQIEEQLEKVTKFYEKN